MHPKASHRWLMAALTLVLLVVLAGGGWFYRAQEQHLRDQAEQDLEAIAALKANEIAAWRTNQLANAAVLGRNLFIIEGVLRWLADPRGEQAEAILAWFRVLQEHYGYRDVVLVDSDGQARLSLSGQLDPLGDEVAQTLTAAWDDRQPVLTDLYRGYGGAPPRIGVIAPLFASSQPEAAPLGALILQSEAANSLYPLIQSWPTPSKSAETLLVRQDGDAVLHLNDLRHQPGTALTLRVPLSETDVLTVMAVLGRRGVVEGKDSRGVEVLSVLHAIPDSLWFIVVKVDKAEALAEWRTRSSLTIALILGLVVMVGTVWGAIWQRTQKTHYRRLFQAEKARHESEARHHAVLLSIGDGVITTDAEGRVELLNLVAETLTGWSTGEARGRPLEEVFRIVNEETRQPVANPVHRVMQEGLLIGLANHTLLIARDGREIPIADSGAPIFDPDGNLSGVVLAFRDQTEERAAQKALRASEERYRHLVELSPVALFVNRNNRIEYINPAGLTLFGATSAEQIIGKTPYDVFHPDYHALIRERIRLLAEDRQAVPLMEEQIVRLDGTVRDVEVTASPFTDQKGAAIQVVLHDITERKQAQRAEHEERALAEALADTASALISALDFDAVMHTILQNVARVVPNDASNIMLITDGYAQVVYWHGYGPEKTPYIQEFRIPVAQTQSLQHMLATGSPFLIAHTDQYPAWVHLPVTEWVKSYVGVPIWSHDNVIGFLNLDSGTPGFFNESHAERLRAFAHLVSIAIEHAQLYEQIQRHADELEQRVKERTAQLSQTLRRIEAILNSSTDIIVLCRPDGTISQVNPAFDETFQCQPDAALFQPLTSLVVAEHAPLLEQAFQGVIRTAQPHRLEVVVHCEGRGTFDADVVLSPIVEEQAGRVSGVVCSLRDITLRKRMEAQLRQTLEQEIELSALKSRYVSMAAHDLRNPLAIIQSAVTLLEHYSERMSAEEKRERHSVIRDSIGRMVTLLDDILIIGRAESGKLTFNPAPLDVIAFCQDLAEEARQAGGTTRLIDFSYQGTCAGASLDANLLRHILDNLLSNAIKYSPAESTITFSLDCQPDRIVFRVQDQGIGIPEADQARLFEAFHRASNVGHRPGTGLGLAIVKQSVDLHGGTIAFESTEGVGTTFTVVIPQAPS